MQRKVLIVEREADEAEALRRALAGAGYPCAWAASGREALACGERETFDLTVLDGSLPGESAEDVLRQLKLRSRFLIAVAGAHGDPASIARLLAAGADDYVVKPVDAGELLLRASVQLQREKEGGMGKLCYKQLVLDPVTFGVQLCGKPLSLTRQEFRILELMISSTPGRVFSKQDFFNYAWDDYYVGADKTISVHICNIRRKIRQITDEKYIETVRSFGFRLA